MMATFRLTHNSIANLKLFVLRPFKACNYTFKNFYSLIIYLFIYFLFAITPNKAIQPLNSKELHKGGNYEIENLAYSKDFTIK